MAGMTFSKHMSNVGKIYNIYTYKGRVVQKGDVSEILTHIAMRTASSDVGGGKNHSLGSVSLVQSSYKVITHIL